MFCPQCNAEYREGFARCSDCLVSLVAERPRPPERNPDLEYATVLQAGNPAVVAVAKSLLRSAEIEYLVIGEELQDVIGWGRLGSGHNLAAGPVCISVRREDEADATEILRELQDSGTEAGSPDTVEATESGDVENEIGQAIPTDISGWPWKRQLRLLSEAVVVLLVAGALLQRHLVDRRDWQYGELAVRYVERWQDRDAALAAQPRGIQKVIRAWNMDPQDKAAWAAHVYSDALNFLDRYRYAEFQEQAAAIRARLAITLAECGRRGPAAELLPTIISAVRPDTNMARLVARISRSYGLGVVSPETEALPSELLPGWSEDTLDARWAETTGDLRAAAEAHARIRERAATPLGWAIGIMAIEIVAIVAGLLMLLRLNWRRPLLPPLSTPWTLRAGVWAVVLGYFWTSAAEYAVGSLRLPDDAALGIWALLIVPLPWLLVLRRRLLRPTGTEARVAFGLQDWKGRGWALAIWTAAAYGTVLLGEAVIQYLARRHSYGDWASHLSEYLVFGSPFVVAMIGSSSVIIGPVVEEVVFRGILYGSLRNRLAPFPAAILSSMAFAAIHPYHFVSLVGVAWTGFAFCFAYERSRSLAPPVIAHMLLNFFWFLGVLTMFR